MPDNELRVETRVNVAPIKAGMADAAAAVKQGAGSMSDGYRAVADAMIKLRSETLNVSGVMAQAMGRDQVVAKLATDDLSAAVQRQVQAKIQLQAATRAIAEEVRKEAAAELEDAAATEANAAAHAHAVPQFAAASAFVRTLEGGSTLRAAERFLTSTLGIGGMLQSIFPILGGIAFAEILVRMVTSMTELVAQALIYTKAMKEAYAAQVASNNEILRATEHTKQLEAEHYSNTHSGVENVTKAIGEETAKQTALNTEIAKQEAALATIQQRMMATSAEQKKIHDLNVGAGAADGPFVPHTNGDDDRAVAAAAAKLGELRAELKESTTQATVLNDRLNDEKDKALKEATKAADQLNARIDKNLTTLIRFGQLTGKQLEEQFDKNTHTVQRELDKQEKMFIQSGDKKIKEGERDLRAMEAALDEEARAAQESYKSQEDGLKLLYDTHQINQHTYLTRLRKLHQDELQAEAETIRKKLELLRSDPTMDPVKLQQVENQLTQISARAKRQDVADTDAMVRANQQKFDSFSRSVSSSFRTALDGWIQGTQTFGQAWARALGGMVANLITTVAQMGVQFLLAEMMHKESSARMIFVDAKTAAAHAFKWAMESVPFPANAVVAPVAAAGAFMGVMAFNAFERGGLVPETGPALLHAREMVLPAHIAGPLQTALATGGLGGGVNLHSHYTIQTMDPISLRSYLEANGDVIGGIALKHVRKQFKNGAKV